MLHYHNLSQVNNKERNEQKQANKEKNFQNLTNIKTILKMKMEGNHTTGKE